MRETAPAPKSNAALRDKVARGGTTVGVNPLEPNVNEGVRTIYLDKTEDRFDAPRLADYEARGYTIQPEGYRFRLSISQETFEAQERERMAISTRRSQVRKDPSMLRDDLETLAPVSASDFIGLAPTLEGVGGASEF